VNDIYPVGLKAEDSCEGDSRLDGRSRDCCETISR